MSPATTPVNEDDMGEVPDLITAVEVAIEDLRTCECVETQADLIVNLQAAIASIDEAKRSIVTLLAQAKSNVGVKS